jgi:hypothetical protein
LGGPTQLKTESIQIFFLGLKQKEKCTSVFAILRDSRLGEDLEIDETPGHELHG